MKMFVLEDDGDIRAAVVRFLEAAGYAVDAAATWIDAHEHLSRKRFETSPAASPTNDQA